MEVISEAMLARRELRKRRVLALSIGVLLTLCLAELSVRVLDVPPTPLQPLYVPSYQLSDDPVLLYEYRPSYRGEGGGYDGGHRTIFTNSFGFRDRERALEKPPGILRILALGDSTTAGVGIEEAEDVYPQVLERRLQERPGDTQYEVFNMGVGGYYTAQEVRALELKGLAFEPDLVTVLFCVNDFYADADGDVKQRLAAADSHLQAGNAPQGSLLGAALQRSRLAFCVYHRVRLWVESWGGKVSASDDSLVEDGLRRLRELQDEHGFRALVFILPALKQPWDEYRYQEVHDKLRAIAARHDLEVIDLKPDFMALGSNADPLRTDALHPNIAGNAALAEMLERHINARWIDLEVER